MEIPRNQLKGQDSLCVNQAGWEDQWSLCICYMTAIILISALWGNLPSAAHTLGLCYTFALASTFAVASGLQCLVSTVTDLLNQFATHIWLYAISLQDSTSVYYHQWHNNAGSLMCIAIIHNYPCLLPRGGLAQIIMLAEPLAWSAIYWICNILTRFH